MQTLFAKTYLRSAAIILAVTGFGKVPWLFALFNCLDDPILGDHQPDWLSNMGVNGFAAGVELGILVLICFSPIKWLPCLAAALWGSLCLLVRLFTPTEDGYQCHCLGLIDMPTVVVVLVAGWLAVGGWVAFRLAGRESSPRRTPPLQKSVAATIIHWIWLSGLGAASLLGGLRMVFHRANYSEYHSAGNGEFPLGPLWLALGFPLLAVAIVAFIILGTSQGYSRQKSAKQFGW